MDMKEGSDNRSIGKEPNWGRRFRDAIRALEQNRFDFPVPTGSDEEQRELAGALEDLKKALETQQDEIRAKERVTERINAGLTLEEVFNEAFEAFREIIPYNRIGLALIESDGDTIRAHWSRSDTPEIHLENGYEASLGGSSLEEIVRTGRPRIINDLRKYLEKKPDSLSTRKIVAEGIRSSLTCPLILDQKPTGFIFFSSMKPGTYRDVHVDTFLEIAGQVSRIVEKSRLYERLEELNDLKNKLLGIAAHDLRNPIGVIRGFTELLLEGDFGSVNDQQSSFLHKIKRNCNNILTMIDDLLDISAIESGKLEINIREVDLGSYLEEYHKFCELMAGRKNMKVLLEIKSDLPLVRFDPDRIRQVLDNLVGNAIKYSYPGSRIIIRVEGSGEEIIVSVIDEGQGIPEDEIPLLLSDFTKGSARPTGGEKSTGLGLAIVRRILESHEGRLEIQRNPDKGSTFRFFLPVNGPGNKTYFK